MRVKKTFVIIMALFLAAGLFVAVLASELEAEPRGPHWAQGAIDRWSALYEDYGAAENPDGAMTLGEAARLFVALLGLRSDDGSYEAAIGRCMTAGLLDAANIRAEGNGAVSRETFFVMLVRALHIPEELEPEVIFDDFNMVSPWAWGSVCALINRGCVNGVGPGVLDPGGEMSRAGALSLLDRMVTVYVGADSALVENGSGLVLVAARDAIVGGEMSRVVVAGGAAGGTTTLENALVTDGVAVDAGSDLVLSGRTEVNELSVAASAGDIGVEIGENAALRALRAEPERLRVFGAGAGAWATESAEEAAAEAEPPEPGEGPSGAADALPEPERVGPAWLVDYGNPAQLPFDSYEVTGEAARPGANYDVLVTVTMEGLRPSQGRRGAGVGWWTGFSVTAPEGAEGAAAAYSPTGENFGMATASALTDGTYTHYFDAARWTEYYVRLAWLGDAFPDPEENAGAWTVYKLDFSGAALDVGALTEEGGPLGRLGTARLADLAEGQMHKDSLYTSYGVSVAPVRDGGGAYLEVTVSAEGLESFRTSAGIGHWAGFSVAAPADAGSYKYAAYLGADTARRNFAGKEPVAWESFAADVDGEGAYGLAQWTDAAREDQRDYWAVLQWFSDAEGAVPLTAPEVYHIVLDVSLAGGEET